MTPTRALLAAVVILTLSNVFTIVEVLGVATDTQRQAQRLDDSQRSQLANRTANVSTWCSAINQGRDYARVLRAASHQSPYLLPDLNCKALEMGTLRSAKPKP